MAEGFKKWIVRNHERLDIFLTNHVGQISRNRIQGLIRSGKAQVNGRIINIPSYILKKYDTITLNQTGVQGFVSVSNFPIPKILIQTPDLWVLDKPAGVSVHPGQAHTGDTISDWVASQGIKAGASDRPGIVHRLDKDTSGVLLVAKTEKMYQYLTSLFRERKISKEYTVLVHGSFNPPRGQIELAVGRLSGKLKLRSGRGRGALTTYQVLKTLDGYSLLHVHLHTGRTHQIRVHMEAIHHPVAGDQLYCPRHLRKKDALFGITRQFIHASRIIFPLPDRTVLDVESHLPEDLQLVLDRIKK